MDIDQISLAITEYRNGDLLGLSDLIDAAEKFQATCQAHSASAALAGAFLGYLRSRFHDGQPLRRDFLTDSLDHLRFILKQNPESLAALEPDLQSMLETWRSRFADCLVESAPEQATIETTAGSQPPEPQAAAPEILDPFVQEETFKIFIMDARERLTNAQELCIRLEQNPEDLPTIQELFRIFHTFKGECGFFKLTVIGELAHNYENLLDLVRQRELVVDSQKVDLLLRGIDRFQVLIGQLGAKDGADQPEVAISDLVHDIEAIRFQARLPIGERLVAMGSINEEQRQFILEKQKATGFAQTFGELAVEQHLVTSKDLIASFAQEKENRASPQTQQATVKDEYIKVQSAQINFLVDMIGELIIAQNQLDSKDPGILPLRKITKEIQLAALKLRTTKLTTVAMNGHRALRDVAQKLGKAVDFQSRGEDLEIDRDLVEGLTEPLLHIIRNAVHHGIETASERVAQGKPAEGTVLLEAQRRGNSIVLSVEDDGKGLNRAVILRKAVETGMISVERSQGMSDTEVWDLIFQPGFSTAETVDQISGRGVGMDIVRTFVLAHRGRIEIQTAAGQFSRISMYFPISTAIIDGMIASVGELTVILPVNQVVESLNFTQFETYQVGGSVDVINLRGVILPVIDMSGFFDQAVASDGRRIGVVVEDSFRKRYVFLVDRIIGKREVVVKSLGSRFKGIKAISAGTVLAGGLIGYIVDIEHIIRESGVGTSP